MHGDLSALVKSAQKIRQNRLTHVCVAVVNRLDNQIQKNIRAFREHYLISQNPSR